MQGKCILYILLSEKKNADTFQEKMGNFALIAAFSTIGS